MKVSIVIPTHDEGPWLASTVAAVVEGTDEPDYEIVVVDDGSTDGSAAFLSEGAWDRVGVFRQDPPGGPGAAKNAGAAVAAGEHLVFLDAHVAPQHGRWLGELLEPLGDPRVGASTLVITSMDAPHRVGKVYTITNLLLEPGWVEPRSRTARHLVPAVPGACCAVRREVFQASGGFDPGIRGFGREEIEFSLRLWRLGYDLSLSLRASLAHRFKLDALPGPEATRDLYWERLLTNVLRTALTHLPPDWVRRVSEALEREHGARVREILASLSADTAFLERREALAARFVRGFDEYLAEFGDLLPIARFAPGRPPASGAAPVERTGGGAGRAADPRTVAEDPPATRSALPCPDGRVLTLEPLNGWTAARFAPMTFPRYAAALRLAGPRDELAGVGAWVDDQPAGLVLARIPPGGRDSQVLSLFVAEPYRRLGAGEALLAAVEREARRRGADRLEVVFTRGDRTEPLERLLARHGWEPPRPRMLLFKVRGDAVDAPFLRPRARAQGVDLFAWADLRIHERLGLVRRQRERPWFPDRLSPFQEPATMEPVNSLGMRVDGEVAGWMITHRISPDTIRYTALWVREDLRGRGLAFALLGRAAALQVSALGRGSYGTLGVLPDNRAMRAIVSARLAPYLVYARESCETGRVLP